MELNRKLIRQYGARNKRLKQLGFDSYEDYLKSDIWKAIREKAKKRGGHWSKCKVCGSTESIQLHHTKYKKIAKVMLGNLTPLCRPCHRAVHDISLNSKKSLKQALKSYIRKYKKLYAISPRPNQKP